MKNRSKSRQSRVVRLPSTSKSPQSSPDETLKGSPAPGQSPPQVSAEERLKVKAVQKNFADLTVALRAMNAQVQYLSQGQTSDSILLSTLDHLDEDLGKFVDAMWAIRETLTEAMTKAESGNGETEAI